MAPNYSLHAQVVDPPDLMEATNSLAQSQRDLDIGDLEDILDRNPSYVRSVVNLGEELGFILHQNGMYSAHPDMALQVRQANREQEKQDLLRLRLQRYRPFIKFIKNLLDGGDATQAARQVRVFYQLGSDDNVIKDQFVQLAGYAGILTADGSDLEYYFNADILSQNYFLGVAESLEDELVSRLFLENRLDEDIIAYMDDESFNELVVALRNFGSDPDDAVAAAGRASETFQRQIGADFGQGSIDYSGPNGVRQLAQSMGSESLTKDRHQLAGEYLGEVRNNSGGHGVDPDTGKHWSLTEEVAFGYILTAVHYIRSLYRWTADDQLVV
jgi:hypothetical protein